MPIGGDRHTWMPSQTRYAPPTHFMTVSHASDAFSSAPMPNIDRAMTATKPTAPPKIVYSALRRPCSAPCVSASRPLGPGDSESPVAADR